MPKEKVNEKPKKDIIFQITDWDTYHEADEEGLEKYAIRLYGITKKEKRVYVRVDGFTPYFFVEIPKKWDKRMVTMFMDTVKKKVNEDHVESLKSYDIIKKHKFRGFTNYGVFNFVRLIFHNYTGFRAFKSIFYRKIFNRFLGPRPIKFNMYESNIDPFLRCMHIRKLDACGWVKINSSDYEYFNKGDEPSHNDINIHCKWTVLNKHEDTSIAPLTIASFDIECTSADGSFPQPHRDGDKVIQIGTTINKYGSSKCYYKHIVTLKSCDPIEGVDVEHYETEREVLLAWTRMISKMNPDIMTGYNIFGFDYKYLAARAKKLGCYSKFSQLGRIKNEISEFVEKQLSSAALGDNRLYYYNMSGRVQIDLMKVVMRDYSLTSYKLDNVASNFIKEKIKSIDIRKKKKRTIIHTKSIYGLSVGRFIKIYYNDGLSDNAYKDSQKFKILKLIEKTEDSDPKIIISGILDNEILGIGKYKVFWCQAKDDVSPADIFRLQKGSSADRATVAKYCVQDCLLCNKLIDKLQIITNNIAMSNVCSVPLSYIFLRGQGVKILSLVAKKCRQKNHLIPLLQRPRDGVDEEGFEGATVLEPKVGVHFEPIPVLDYASLYPSSMIHRNISHECLVFNDDKYGNLSGYNYSVVTFYNNDGTPKTCKYAKKIDGDIGIIPEILKDLLGARKATKKLMKAEKDQFKKNIYNGLQLAFKVTANSLYGQTGAKTSAIYLRDVAASTTATGRDLLNAAVVFTEVLFPIIVNSILDDDYDTYEKKINQLLDNELDELMGPEVVKDLKTVKPGDRMCNYHYIEVFGEKLEKLTDEDFVNEKLGHTCREDFISHYREAMLQQLKGLKITPVCIYGDTDSIFVNYNIADGKTGKNLTDNNVLKIAIKVGVLCGDLINYILPPPQNLEYEKTFDPWIILSKKRYVGNLYEFDPNDYYQKSMGIVLKRRDNAPIVKIAVGGIVDKILNEKSAEKAVEFIKTTLKDILSEKYPMEKFIVTKTLRTDYADRTRIAHAALADRMAERDPGNKPQSNDRIPYVYIVTDKKKPLQGERVEHPDYVIKNNLKLDYLFYITNQIMKPAIQFLEQLVEDPEQIFTDHINRELNRRKGQRPIKYYLDKMKDGSFIEEVVDETKGFNCYDDLPTKEVEQKVKRKKNKKKVEKNKEDDILTIGENGGFIIDL